MAPWSEWKAKALEGTQQLNPGLVLHGLQPVYNKRILAANTEGVQLFFRAAGCDPGTQHVHLRTPHGVNKPEHLKCLLCPSYVAARVQYGTERQVIEHVRQSRDGHNVLLGFVCQWAPRWWKGRVDFYHYPTETIIQVDGPPHFEGHRNQQPCLLLQKDIECCVKVLQQHGRMLRIHHMDIEESAEAVHKAINKEGAFIALSPKFADVSDVQGNIVKSYMSMICNRLECDVTRDDDSMIWLSLLTV